MAKIQEAAELYPTEWIEASNEHSLLLASSTTKRAHYADWHDIEDTEPAQKVQRKAVSPLMVAKVGEPSPKGPMRETGDYLRGSYRDPKTKQTVYANFPVYEQDEWEVIKPWQKFRAKKDGSPWGKG
jgi:hypothetical protein